MATKKKKDGSKKRVGTATGNESRGYEKIDEASLTPSMRKRLAQIRGGTASDDPQTMLGTYKKK